MTEMFHIKLLLDFNNNHNQLNEQPTTNAADVALATHDYTNRSLTQGAEERCFPCTYQGCAKVIDVSLKM